MINKNSNQKKWNKSILATTISGLLLTNVVWAQEVEETNDDIEVISVTYRASLVAAAEIKRESMKVVDYITSEDIGKFPTENIAEAIQRIPGVQISNLNGRGSTISIRGLGPQYSRVSVNGQTFKSADFTGGFRFDIIQSELASTIGVYKSPTANMDAGGLSGTINIDTTDPLFYTERKLILSAKAQNSELSPNGDVTPKSNVTYIDQFADNTVGIFLNAGYQELSDRVDNMWMGRWFPDNGDGTEPEYPRRPRFSRHERETQRTLLNGAIQWRPNDAFETKLTAVYANDDTQSDVQQQVFLFNDDQITKIGSPINNAFTHIQIDNFTLENNRQLEDKTATSQAITLEADYYWQDWNFSSVLNYTSGKAVLEEEAAILATKLSANLDITDANNVVFIPSTDLSDASLYPIDAPRNQYPVGARRDQQSDESSFQFDAVRAFGEGFFTSVAMGIKYRAETFDRIVHRNDRVRTPEFAVDPVDLPLMSEHGEIITDFLDNQMSIPHSWIVPNVKAYREALKAEGVVIPSYLEAQNSYSIDRSITSVYAMFDFETELGGMPIRGNVGGRYEITDRDINTNITGEGFAGSGAKQIVDTYTSSYDYNNFLPSTNIVMELNDDMQVRFAAAQVLVRPIITSGTSIAPSESTSVNSEGTTIITVNLGQPKIEALTANQMDLGYEWYYGEGNLFSVGLFWKDIKNGTVNEFVCPSDYNGVSLSGSAGNCVNSVGDIYEVQSTVNDASNVTIKGYEIALNQSFDEFLPVDGFGLSTNYTRIILDEDEDAGFALTNSSEHTFNFTGYWENETFSARASLNHRSAYAQVGSDAFFAREGRVVEGRDQIDLLFGWTVSDNLNLRFGALNIFSENEESYRSEQTPVWQTTTAIGSSYYLSATYSF